MKIIKKFEEWDSLPSDAQFLASAIEIGYLRSGKTVFYFLVDQDETLQAPNVASK